MNYKIYLFLSIFSLQIYSFAQDKTIYYDANWKVTTIKNAEFYRPMPLLKLGNLEMIRDYYFKTKKMQMQGYFADGIEKNYAGELFWYDKNGESTSQSNYINKTKQKKLNYYFENGNLWKSVEYGDSLKNGKTTEYKIDGSILGESFYNEGHLVSGISGEINRDNLSKYNLKTQNEEYVRLPAYTGPEKNYTITYYWLSTLKTAVEYIYKGENRVAEKNYDKSGALIQQLDSTSYFNDDENSLILKNGRDYNYDLNNSGVISEPRYVNYESFPFSNVQLNDVEFIILYRGTIHFLQKKTAVALYNLIDYQIINDKEQSFVSLQSYQNARDNGQPLEYFEGKEAKIIPVAEIPELSRKQLFDRFSTKTWFNPDLKDKNAEEKLYFASQEFLGSTIKTKNLSKNNSQKSKVIYIQLAPSKYIIMVQSGGYLIPKNDGDILEIPNFKLD